MILLQIELAQEKIRRGNINDIEKKVPHLNLNDSYLQIELAQEKKIPHLNPNNSYLTQEKIRRGNINGIEKKSLTLV